MYFLCKFNVKCPKWSFFYVENKNGYVRSPSGFVKVSITIFKALGFTENLWIENDIHTLNRVRTGHGKPGKSWNARISFSRPGKSWNFIFSH